MKANAPFAVKHLVSSWKQGFGWEAGGTCENLWLTGDSWILSSQNFTYRKGGLTTGIQGRWSGIDHRENRNGKQHLPSSPRRVQDTRVRLTAHHPAATLQNLDILIPSPALPANNPSFKSFSSSQGTISDLQGNSPKSTAWICSPARSPSTRQDAPTQRVCVLLTTNKASAIVITEGQEHHNVEKGTSKARKIRENERQVHFLLVWKHI